MRAVSWAVMIASRERVAQREGLRVADAPSCCQERCLGARRASQIGEAGSEGC